MNQILNHMNILNKIKKIISFTIAALILFAIYVLIFTYAEPKAYDFMVKNISTNKLPFDTQKQVYGNDDIILVVIDDKSSERYRWPWKRNLYCNIFNYMKYYAHPKVVVHDSILSTKDIDNPESDKEYFECLKTINNLIVGFYPSTKQYDNLSFGENYDKKFKEKFSKSLNDYSSGTIEIYKSILPFPKTYFDSVKHAGSVSIFPGAINGNMFIMDEVYRTQSYLFSYKNDYYPSLAMETFLFLNDYPEITLTNNKIIMPNTEIYQNNSLYRMSTPMKFYKLYPDGYSHKKYSAIDIIDSYKLIKSGNKPLIEPEIFKNKIVILGANVPAGAGLNDNKNSPVSVNHPGVDFQATAIDNIIHNDFIKVIPQFINLIITTIGMLLIFLSIKLLNMQKAASSILAINVIYILTACICFYFNCVINVITPLVMFAITMIAGYSDKSFSEYKSKEKVKTVMGKYMSEDVMKNVLKNIDNLGLGGKKSVVTVLFSDIRGFTSMSEKMTAQEVSEFLNEYFSQMEPIITKYNGIINKFIGDAIMAVFGEPIQDDNHPINAVNCAYEMLNKVEELNKKWQNDGKPNLSIGIGINTGEVFIGNIGSEKRMEYTVIGDTVNLASRLESYNKEFKTKLLISDSTYQNVKDIFETEEIKDVHIRGKENTMSIYKVLNPKEQIS